MEQILDLIPIGRENAIKRRDLRELCGYSDRDMRRAIEVARQSEPIINLSDGCGYYRPETKEELTKYILQESARIKAINKNLKVAIKRYNEIEGQMNLGGEQ